jgi:uncharacterized protein YdeI (YjbR/CyaY-like superfamily)
MAQPSPKVDEFLARAKRWQAEMAALRAIILSCPLQEDLKWHWPCYALQGSNVVLVHGFKEHFDALFFKGALLKDAKGLLVKPGEHHEGARQMRFTSLAEVAEKAADLRAYVKEAIAIEQAGLKVERKPGAAAAMPAELKAELAKDKALKAAFEALTPGRQRAYCLFIGSAKQPETRVARIAKWRPQILRGKGMAD